jgi:gliding motility-associated-like protein
VEGFADCASFIDTFVVNVIPPIGLFPELGEDLLICEESWQETFTVPTGFETYEWSNGETDESITVAEAGTYTITVESACETFTDAVTITEDPFLNAVINLGPDLILCPAGNINELVITTDGTLPNYTWSNGATTESITITEPGTYFVSSELLCGNPSDTLRVTYCEDIGVPNVFSPNGDGFNDNAFVIVMDPTRVLSFRIYNRWGEMLFDGNANNLSWNGTFEGKEQPIGSYVYVLQYLSTTGEQLSQQGNITLVR